MDEDNIRIGRLLQVARERHRVSQAALCDTTGRKVRYAIINSNKKTAQLLLFN